MSSENPFADPFKDPSITRAAARTTITEDFNPFASNVPASSASVPTHQASSSGRPAAQNRDAMTDELFRKQEELERKAEELRRREEELERRRVSGTGGVGTAPRPHNWPPVPTFIPIEPCFYQDIEVEIPSEFQKTVTMVYHVYLVYVLALALNVLTSLIYCFGAEGGIGIVILSIVELALFSPCAFLFWFRPVYKAFRNDSSFNFMVFFFVLFFHCLFCLVQTLGLNNYGVGWINALETFSTHPLVAFIMLLSALVFSVALAGMVFSLIKVHHLYRGGGFSFDKARQEFTNGVMADRNVQAAAGAAATAAAGAAVQNAARGRF